MDGVAEAAGGAVEDGAGEGAAVRCGEEVAVEGGVVGFEGAVADEGGGAPLGGVGGEGGAEVGEVVEVGGQDPGAEAVALEAEAEIGADAPPDEGRALVVGPDRDDPGGRIPAEEGLVLDGGRRGGRGRQSCQSVGGRAAHTAYHDLFQPRDAARA